VPPPRGLDEWGPVCHGCGDKEYRIDGFCSIECRDQFEFVYELLTRIAPDEQESDSIPANDNPAAKRPATENASQTDYLEDCHDPDCRLCRGEDA
jgi:hypothetical protein